MDEGIEQILGRRVRELRVAQGLTKTDFCLMVGISRPYLNRIEEGRANVTLRQLSRLASGLGVPAVDLISR